MNYTNLNYEIGLTLLRGVGPVKAKEILQKFDDLSALFYSSPLEISKTTGYTTQFVRSMGREKALEKSEKIIADIDKNNIEALCINNSKYPSRLKNCIDSPIVLYYKGTQALNASKVVSIVGTRNATKYGKDLCEDLIRSLSGMDVVVVSGLASGIDTCVHSSCLANNIPTIGVLGHSLDRIYPYNNRSLANEMLSNGGLITEFIPNTKPDRENFPKRNRIVAGMADATIVIESKSKGGSLITARLANDYNKDVFAFPGNVNNVNSQGCNELISQNKAHLIQSCDDFLTFMSWSKEKKPSVVQQRLLPSLTLIQQKILSTVQSIGTVNIDRLSLQTNIPIHTLNQELFVLELDGLVVSSPGQAYTIK